LPDRIGNLKGLYGISRSALAAFEQTEFEGTLVVVHTLETWAEYGTLLTLTPPFSDNDLVLVYSRSNSANARVIAAFPDRPVYHYYADEPGVLHETPR
jgi:hypothetical protein